MAHYVSIADGLRNPDLRDPMGQFIDQRPPGHTCLPQCAEIGGEPESPEMYGRPASPGDRSYSDGSGEVCISCGGPHFDCSDPASWEDD